MPSTSPSDLNFDNASLESVKAPEASPDPSAETPGGQCDATSYDAAKKALESGDA
eukprot:CAMPEP_0185905452 /NCGR_PEP_ID=MMETSP0196C-20130402/4655_1 /TAXON_ID=2932 /ORGANISM="Alexandrium fundyense, Strain CCMP1719" /LENGTH=54 /DNA_ID=CAMNT_0028624977 /DNA_START=38 /DNA_END=199 /DNA_ORIENTATION=+